MYYWNTTQFHYTEYRPNSQWLFSCVMYMFKLSFLLLIPTSGLRKKKDFINGFEQLTDHEYHQETIEE